MTYSVPIDGSRWVWEIDKDHARNLIEVIRTTWNGEEIWVTAKTLPDLDNREAPMRIQNELSRFWEAVTPVGGTVNMLSEILVIKE